MRQALFLYPVLIVPVLALLPGCGSLQEPVFKGIENLKVVRLGKLESTLIFDLHFFNRNNSKIQLKNVQGDAWLDGVSLGHFTVDTLIRIPAKEDFRLLVRLKIDMKYLLHNTTAILLNNEVMLRIQGIAKVGRGTVFIRYPIHYEGKQNLDELLR